MPTVCIIVLYSPTCLEVRNYRESGAITVANVFWKLFPSAPLLLLVGLARLHIRISGRSGWLERSGFYVTLLGLVLILAGAVGEYWPRVDDAYIMTAPAYRVFRIGCSPWPSGPSCLASPPGGTRRCRCGGAAVRHRGPVRPDLCRVKGPRFLRGGALGCVWPGVGVARPRPANE